MTQFGLDRLKKALCDAGSKVFRTHRHAPDMPFVAPDRLVPDGTGNVIRLGDHHEHGHLGEPVLDRLGRHHRVCESLGGVAVSIWFEGQPKARENRVGILVSRPADIDRGCAVLETDAVSQMASPPNAAGAVNSSWRTPRFARITRCDGTLAGRVVIST